MMARIAGISRGRTLVARLAFFLSRRSYGRVITPARVYALDSRLLLAVGLMEEVQEWAKQTRAPVKQLARMLVAWRIGCPWCLDFGTKASEQLGVTAEQLVALRDYEHSSLFNEEERAVLRYADAMTSTPVRVPDSIFEALTSRYTDRQILEITAAIAWENFHARVNHALDLEAEGVAGRVCLVPEEGYPPQSASDGGRSMRKRAKYGEAEGVPLPHDVRMLTHEQARAFYNRMGAKQDWQAFYEAKATHDLIAHASFETAQAVFEFGCGTGALAERLLASYLPPEARYVAVDSSTAMVRLAQARLARFGSRVTVQQTDGSLQLEAASASYDRFVSTYVVDLLSPSDIAALLSEAHRLLMPEGRLCLVSLTHGTGGLSRLVTALWTRIHRFAPTLVGGCRPLELHTLLEGRSFQVGYVQTVAAFGIPSEIVIAMRQPEERATPEEGAMQ
jgi:AhpD family alkylhydroperoxidase